jgi:hypothetical protein
MKTMEPPEELEGGQERMSGLFLEWEKLTRQLGKELRQARKAGRWYEYCRAVGLNLGEAWRIILATTQEDEEHGNTRRT